MSDNLLLINQVYVALAPKGVSRDAVAKLDDTTLQEILGKITTGEELEEIIGYAIEKAPDLADSETLQKNREIREENGKTIIDEKNGGELAQRTIIEKDGDNLIETVIVYSGGKPASKTVKKNGNTTETSTYESVTTSEYLTEEERNEGKQIIKINTDRRNSDGSHGTTYVTEVDVNGNYTDDELLEQESVSISGETHRISRTDDGNLSEFVNTANGRTTTLYKGTDFEAYRNGTAEVISTTAVERDIPLCTNQMENFASIELLENDSPFNEVVRIAGQMRDVQLGQNIGQLDYDKSKLARLFGSITDSNSGYVKISDNPPVYGKPVTDNEGNVTYSEKIVFQLRHNRLQYKGSFRDFEEKDEYYIANETPGQEGVYYRFSADGTFKSLTKVDFNNPNTETHFLPNGKTEIVTYDENGNIQTAQFENSKHQLTSVLSYETDDEGNIYTDQIYTEYEYNPEFQNRRVILFSNGNMMVYKQDEEGNYNVLDKQRICQTIPIRNNMMFGEEVGTTPITFLTVDGNGLVQEEGLFNRQSLYQYLDVSKGESIDFSEFDENTRNTTVDMIINTLEGVIGKYKEKKEDTSWLDASTWFRHLAGATIEEKIETLEGYLEKAKKLKDNVGNLNEFNAIFSEIAGCGFNECQERFVRYNQKIEAMHYNLGTIYTSYKQNNGELSPEEKSAFAQYCGQKVFDGVTLAHLKNFIAESDKNISDAKYEGSPFLGTNLANNYIASLTKDPMSTTQVGRTVENFESEEKALDIVGGTLDLASMVMEFGAISKMLNWTFKGAKFLTKLGTPNKVAKALGVANEFIQGEGRVSHATRFVTQLTTRAVVGGANFAAYDMLHETGRQIYNDEDLDGNKILHKGWLGFKTGAAAGVLSTVISEPLLKWVRGKGNVNVLKAVEKELEQGGASLTGERLGSAMKLAQAMPKYNSLREVAAKGVGFLTEVGTFTVASSTINLLDESEIKKTLLRSGYKEEDLKDMSKTDLMKEVLRTQDIDTKDMSDSEIYWAYMKNEYSNQFVGLGQLKLAESVLGMFLSKGKMPTPGTQCGPREKALEFVPNERGKYYLKSDMTKRELSSEEITAIVQNAIAFDAVEARLKNRFNDYSNLSGQEFINIIHGKEKSEPITGRELNAGDNMKIEMKDGKFVVTTKDGHTEKVETLEEVMAIYEISCAIDETQRSQSVYTNTIDSSATLDGDLIRIGNKADVQRTIFNETCPETQTRSNIDTYNFSTRKNNIEENLRVDENFDNSRLNILLNSITEENIALVEKMCADKDFPKNEIASILSEINDINKPLAEKLCTNKDFPKDKIATILRCVNENNLDLAEKLCADKDFPNKKIAFVIDTVNVKNKALAEKICANKDFPVEEIGIILSAVTDENMALAEKLCADKDFPKEQIGMILASVNSRNKSLAEKLCADKDFPKDCISLVLQRRNNGDIEFIKNLYKGKDFPSKNIPDILVSQNRENILKDTEYLEMIKKYSEQNSRLTTLLIDCYNFKNKKSIIELSKTEKKELIQLLLKYKKDICSETYPESIKDLIQLIPINNSEYANIMVKLAQSLNIDIEPTSPQKTAQFNSALINLQNILKEVDLNDLSDISLTTTHREFVSQVDSIIKDLPKEEQDKIQDYFGFRINNGKLDGYPRYKDKNRSATEISDPRTMEAINRLKPIVDNYINNNFISVKNKPELNQCLKELSKVMPEIFNQFDGSSVPVETIKTLQKIVQKPEFAKLSDSDKKILTIAALLNNNGRLSNNVSETAFDAYFISKKYNLTDIEAQKVYIIISNSDAVERFMQTSKTETLLHYGDSYIGGQHRQDIFDLIAFNLREGNNFEMTQMLYSAKQPDGLTRHFDNLIRLRIDEIKSNDFVLPQTTPDTYKNLSTARTITRDGVEYTVPVVNSENIPDFYAFIHTPESAYTTGGGRTANFANFDAFAVVADDKTVCTSYITNGAAVLVKEYEHGFIFDVKNENQYVGHNHDIFSLCKNVPNMIIEYYRDRGFKASKGKGFKSDHRTFISDTLKSSLYGVDYNTRKTQISEKINKINGKYELQIKQLNEQLHKIYETEYSKHSEYISLQNEIRELKTNRKSMNETEYKQKMKQLSEKESTMTREWYNSMRNRADVTILMTRIKSLDLQKQNEIKRIDGYSELAEIDRLYTERVNKIKEQLGQERMTPTNIAKIDPEFANAYSAILSTEGGILNELAHNEVVISNPTISAIFTFDIDKLPVEYLQKAQTENLPIVIIKE
ncbi:MAG: hypothetical protein K6E29_02550 [Cyanobacteria bacterium RUI128]|nr:hypothetical protein [Cyanobacteria bacterium RUI128]